jgi:hypothetical protein
LEIDYELCLLEPGLGAGKGLLETMVLRGQRIHGQGLGASLLDQMVLCNSIEFPPPTHQRGRVDPLSSQNGANATALASVRLPKNAEFRGDVEATTSGSHL